MRIPAAEGYGVARILSLRDVVVRRRNRVVLDVPAFELPTGSRMAIMGPNGAGKSTLLQVAGALVRPDEGDIWIAGNLLSRTSELALRRHTALVFQDPLLFRRSVLDNVSSGLLFRGTPAGEARARARQWLDRFGVGALAERNGRSLSGGEAQRVNLARAFAVEPSLLLLDEPFAGLDRPTRIHLLDDLAAQLLSSETSLLLVTHDAADARRVCSTIAVLIDGRIAQYGPVDEVLSRPAGPDVAAIVGAD
jgi:tungstate transport system ATP-binding protein